MPRDLFPTKSPSDPTITASPEMKSPSNRSDSDEPEETGGNEYQIFRDERDEMEVELSAKLKAHDDLHPHVQVLSISDLDACVALENACFPENERCSREKFIYRLTTSTSLSLGLYSSSTASPNPSTQSAHDTARVMDSSKPTHKSLLLGQVIATLTTASTVTDLSMDFPRTFPSHPNYQESPTSTSSTDTASPSATASASASASTADPPSQTRPQVLNRQPTDPLPDSSFPRVNQPADVPGHHPLGRTLAIHSVCVHPAYQKLGLGKTLLKSYLQRMEGAGIADKAAVLARPGMVGWYVGCFGFEDKGESKATFGGGGWRDLTYDFKDSSHWT